MLLSMESTSNRMSRLGKSLITDTELLSLEELVERDRRGRRREDIAELAGDLLRLDRLSAAGIGPSEARFRAAIQRVNPALVGRARGMKSPPARAGNGEGRLACSDRRSRRRGTSLSTSSRGRATPPSTSPAPRRSRRTCAVCLQDGVPVVVGTTGFDQERVDALAREHALPVFYAPNFALGAVLMMRFAAEAGKVHAARRDRRAAPRGEARRALGHGEGDRRARCRGETPIHSVRLPGLVAHQEVIFGGPGQTLTIRHDTTSREAFVPGVLLALERLRGLPPGLTVGLDAIL